VLENSKRIFIENLGRLRRKKYRSQASFAEALDVSDRTYQRYEQGETEPDTEMLDRLARALDCKPWELFMPEAEINRRPSASEKLLRCIDIIRSLDDEQLGVVLDDLEFVKGVNRPAKSSVVERSAKPKRMRKG